MKINYKDRGHIVRDNALKYKFGQNAEGLWEFENLTVETFNSSDEAFAFVQRFYDDIGAGRELFHSASRLAEERGYEKEFGYYMMGVFNAKAYLKLPDHAPLIQFPVLDGVIAVPQNELLAWVGQMPGGWTVLSRITGEKVFERLGYEEALEQAQQWLESIHRERVETTLGLYRAQWRKTWPV